MHRATADFNITAAPWQALQANDSPGAQQWVLPAALHPLGAPTVPYLLDTKPLPLTRTRSPGAMLKTSANPAQDAQTQFSHLPEQCTSHHVPGKQLSHAWYFSRPYQTTPAAKAEIQFVAVA